MIRGALAAATLLVWGASRAVAVDAPYFPLHAGNWWAYEEVDTDGARLSRETWTVVAARAEEFELHASTKRLDVLGRSGGRRWDGREYLRMTPAGLRKRYPAGADGEIEVTVLRDPGATGTRWHDAQGDCDATPRDACDGPAGVLHDCASVVCRLGSPTATVVTSTFARGVGMVRQEVEVLQLLPALQGGASVLPSDGAKGGRSVLRLSGYHVAR